MLVLLALALGLWVHNLYNLLDNRRRGTFLVDYLGQAGDPRVARGVLGAAACALALALAPPGARAAAPGPIWEGRATGVPVRWSAGDLVLGGTSLRHELERRWAEEERDFNAEVPRLRKEPYFRDQLTGPPPYTTEEGSWRLLSVVGPLVSVRESLYVYGPGMAHPQVETRFRAYDLGAAGPLHEVRLTDWFPDRQVRDALVADPVVRKALADLHVAPAAAPPTCRGLLALLDTWDADCRIHIGPDALSRFAFHHVAGNRVAVRIGLSHGCEAARGTLTQLGVWLPVPGALRPALRKAAEGREGALGDRFERLAPGQAASASFGRSWRRS